MFDTFERVLSTVSFLMLAFRRTKLQRSSESDSESSVLSRRLASPRHFESTEPPGR